MSLFQKLSNSTFAKTETLSSLIAILAIFGTVIMLSGGIWDATSHIMQEPEYFWTIQHVSVYAGVSMITSSAIICVILLIKHQVSRITKNGAKIIIVGSILQIVSGYGDSISHDIFGIDGLVSWSHQPLELGLVLSAIGGFLIIKSKPSQLHNKLLPISILALILSASWLGFNLLLLAGGVIQCIPVYDIFSSGCAIL